ncbi:hypothetical protein HYS42_00440 [Candidatus Saccharibacteria bacterium]|nr:hypothetical protein [Candidatus Saccharibacteria bacterium]
MTFERLPAADATIDPNDRESAMLLFGFNTIAEGPPVTFDNNGNMHTVFADLSQKLKIFNKNDVPSGFWLPTPVFNKYKEWDQAGYPYSVGDRLDPAVNYMLKAWAYSTSLAEPFVVSFHAFDPEKPKGVMPPPGESGLMIPYVGLLTIDGRYSVEYWCAMSSHRPLEVGLPFVANRLQTSFQLPRDQHIRPNLHLLDTFKLTFPDERAYEIPGGNMHLVPSPQHRNGLDAIHLIPESRAT